MLRDRPSRFRLGSGMEAYWIARAAGIAVTKRNNSAASPLDKRIIVAAPMATDIWLQLGPKIIPIAKIGAEPRNKGLRVTLEMPARLLHHNLDLNPAFKLFDQSIT
jgi:hypothetical protein